MPPEKQPNPTERRLTQNIKLNANSRYFRQMVPHVSFGSSWAPMLRKTANITSELGAETKTFLTKRGRFHLFFGY